jgi:hypothetical protein
MPLGNDQTGTLAGKPDYPKVSTQRPHNESAPRAVNAGAERPVTEATVNDDSTPYIEDDPKAFAIAELKREIERYATEHFGPVHTWHLMSEQPFRFTGDEPRIFYDTKPQRPAPIASITLTHSARIRVFDTDYTARWGYDNGYVAYRISETSAE